MMQNCPDGNPGRRNQVELDINSEPTYSLFLTLQELVVLREDRSLHACVTGGKLVVVISSVVSTLDLELVVFLRLFVFSECDVFELVLYRSDAT